MTISITFSSPVYWYLGDNKEIADIYKALNSKRITELEALVLLKNEDRENILLHLNSILSGTEIIDLYK